MRPEGSQPRESTNAGAVPLALSTDRGPERWGYRRQAPVLVRRDHGRFAGKLPCSCREGVVIFVVFWLMVTLTRWLTSRQAR
jgi:hypothetical protein